jgi:hypothetical protein
LLRLHHVEPDGSILQHLLEHLQLLELLHVETSRCATTTHEVGSCHWSSLQLLLTRTIATTANRKSLLARIGTTATSTHQKGRLLLLQVHASILLLRLLLLHLLALLKILQQLLLGNICSLLALLLLLKALQLLWRETSFSASSSRSEPSLRSSQSRELLLQGELDVVRIASAAATGSSITVLRLRLRRIRHAWHAEPAAIGIVEIGEIRHVEIGAIGLRWLSCSSVWLLLQIVLARLLRLLLPKAKVVKVHGANALFSDTDSSDNSGHVR